MDIPLKSQPKVSMVSLLDDSKFNFTDYETKDRKPNENDILNEQSRTRERDNSSSNTIPISELMTESNGKNYKLSRTDIGIEEDAFKRGTRAYGDTDIRPRAQRQRSTGLGHDPRSHDEYTNYNEGDLLPGLEDEYIPGLNFEDLVYKWNRPSDQNLSGMYTRDENTTNSSSTSNSNTPLSRNASYLDLNKLHAKVSPQPIMLRNQVNSNNKYSFSKLSDFMKARVPQNIQSNTAPAAGVTDNNMELNNSSSTLTSTDYNLDHRNKKLKSHQLVNPATGNINYELILNSLPPNFNELPYSQRRKLVKSFSESIDYSQFSVFAKQYLTDKYIPSSTKTNGSGSNNGSFSRRSRRNSTNTVAGRLLAMSASSSDLKKLEEMKPKTNIDEKGAYVMGYELGRIIGFGAWGTIRECTGDGGTVRAVKIVKSCRNFESSTPNQSLTTDKKTAPEHNPKVLEVFRKEISIWKQLKHDNILPLFDHLETEHAIFCITNRIYGGTLFELVSSWGVYNYSIQNMSGPLEYLIETQKDRLSQAQVFIKQIVSALSYLHEELGVVHGDLKLENVLVDDHNKDDPKVILCDFGMSRVYTSRLSRRPSMTSPKQNSIRSKSSTTDLRKPYHGGDSKSTRHLFKDDSKIGLAHMFKPLGPSLQSVDLTPEQSHSSLFNFHESKGKMSERGIDSDLPHSHIGSLPYASPELLLPTPPPLGPSADIWALGVLMYTMCIGKLPFQHPYEPTLRSLISTGKYDKGDLKKACLLQWIFTDDQAGDIDNDSVDLGKEGTSSVQYDDSSELANDLGKLGSEGSCMFSSSFRDDKREKDIKRLHNQWLQHNKSEFSWMHDMIRGSLQANITKRWDLSTIYDTLNSC